MQCLSREKVAQRVTPGRIRWFHKEILEVDGPEPLAVVRKRRVDGETLAPIVLVHGFGQNRYAWHLPERSFVNYLADQGFDVFNVDLRGHGRSQQLGARPSRGVDDYIRGDLPAVLDGVLELTGFQRAFMMGHSLGGICVAAAAALDVERVAGVITVGPPHALGRGHMVLRSFLQALGHTVGRVGLWRGSRLRLPVDLVGKAVHATRLAWDSNIAPLPVRPYKPGSLSADEVASYVRSFDGATLGTADDLVQLALTGELRSRAHGQSYTKLIEHSPLPLLALSGGADLLANPGSVRPMYERSRSRDKQYLKVDAGHSDLLIGNQAPELVWPVVSSWLKQRAAAAQPAIVETALKAG
jgi:polyhydroxyalkanoate synthase